MMVDFDIAKIVNAIKKGMLDSQYEDQSYVPNVEDIQDVVEQKLMEA